ncbi:MAG: HAMP domain-containing histidine kinase [Bacteroidales bacterium]|nr:HAMP domain-containing histidine kinase [Bacteroidales bacterium]
MSANKNITDEFLLNELKIRFEERNGSINELEILNQKLRDLNKRLLESETMKSHFLSNMSNEIINPFSSIIGLAKIISQASDPVEMKRKAGFLYDEARILDFQFKNIFWAAQLESGKIELHTHKLCLIELVSGVIEKSEYQAAKKNIKFELHTENERCEIDSDAYKLEAILENIFDNAIKFNKNDEKVVVQMMPKGETVQIIIRDFGIGVSPQDLNIIFDRFKKLNEEIYTDNYGQGLGLAVAKELTELIQGEIKVESTVNKGTAFTIELPVNLDLSKQVGSNIFDNGVELF